MRRFFIALLLTLLASPALAQQCPLGSSGVGKECSISDYSVGGALSDFNSIAICQQPNGCFASSPTITYTQVPLSSFKTYLGSGSGGITIPTAQLLGGAASALQPVSVGSGLSLTSGVLSATGGGSLSNMTATQIPVAASPSTVTSSLPQSTWLFSGQPNTALATPSVIGCLHADASGNISKLSSDCGTATGGTGTVTSITAGTGLSASPSSPITTSGTLSLAAGAASANIGTLGGDLSGTLPNPTVSKTGGVAFGPFATVAAPAGPLVGSNGSAIGSVALGSGLSMSGTFPTQTLNLPAGNVTASTLTNNQLVVGTGAATIGPLGAAGTTITLLHGNAAGLPSFGPLALGTDSVTGTVPLANLGLSGTPSTTTFLRGDNTWQIPAGGGNMSTSGTITTSTLGVWASATTMGTLANGTGLLHAGLPPTWSAVNLASADVTGVLPSANGGNGLSGLSVGGVPIAASATTATSSVPLSHPGGTPIATTTGAFTNGHCLQASVSGSNVDIQDAGGSCTTGGGGGTVNGGTSPQIAYYATSTNAVSSAAGVSVPGANTLIVNRNAAAPAASPFTAGNAVTVVGQNDSVGAPSANFLVDSYNGVGGLVFRRADGTQAAPTALADNDSIGSISVFGNSTGGTGGYTTTSSGGLSIRADGAWGSSATATKYAFTETLPATTSPVEVMDLKNGGLVLGNPANTSPPDGSLGPGSINVSGVIQTNASGTTPTASLPSGFVASRIIGPATSVPVRLMVENAGNPSGINFRTANGTLAAATQLAANTQIGSIGWMGYDNSGWLSTANALIQGNAGEAWSTSTTHGAYLQFQTTENGNATSTAHMRLQKGLQLAQDVAGTPPAGGDMGPGTINVPAGGGYYIGGVPLSTGPVDACSTVSKTTSGGYATINLNTGTATSLITGVSGKNTFICSVNVVVGSGGNNVVIYEATGTACGTPRNGMHGGTTPATGWQFGANGGISLGDGNGNVMAAVGATGDNVCIQLGTAAQVSGTVVYVQN